MYKTLRLLGIGCALLVGMAALTPTPAQAWWVAPRVVIAPPAYYPPPRYYAPPVVAYAPPPVYYRHERVWVHGYWRGGYWVAPHWG